MTSLTARAAICHRKKSMKRSHVAPKCGSTTCQLTCPGCSVGSRHESTLASCTGSRSGLLTTEAETHQLGQAISRGLFAVCMFVAPWMALTVPVKVTRCQK